MSTMKTTLAPTTAFARPTEDFVAKLIEDRSSLMKRVAESGVTCIWGLLDAGLWTRAIENAEYALDRDRELRHLSRTDYFVLRDTIEFCKRAQLYDRGSHRRG